MTTGTFEYEDLQGLLPLTPPRREWPDPNLLIYFFDTLLSANEVSRKGVIHLGAHAGQEVLLYTLLGFHRALMVEPLPEQFDALSARCSYMESYAQAQQKIIGESAPPPIQFQCVRCAAAEKSGTATFYQTARTSYSSLVKPDDAANQEWFQSVATEVEMRTLDNIVEMLEDGWTAGDFTYLRMNIQGAELMALKGAENVLKHITTILLEVNLHPRYEDQPSRDDFDRFLGARGFRCAFAAYGDSLRSHANLLYRRS